MAATSVSGIYSIINMVTNERYIGQSKNIYMRWYSHRRELNKGTHKNKHLQKDWADLGENSFSFIVLEEVSAGELDLAEEKHISARFQEAGSHEYNNALGKGTVKRQRKKERMELKNYIKETVYADIRIKLNKVPKGAISLSKLSQVSHILALECLDEFKEDKRFSREFISYWQEMYTTLFVVYAFQNGIVQCHLNQLIAGL